MKIPYSIATTATLLGVPVNVGAIPLLKRIRLASHLAYQQAAQGAGITNITANSAASNLAPAVKSKLAVAGSAADAAACAAEPLARPVRANALRPDPLG